ncbi:unnamed protein product [Ilex paraguariensis]|uniref:Uncharacterized protein n=1 Tax=Ilex paraguariensis TaxID=185542 RepID=A0ABC8UXS4_9AQUA
MGFNCKLCPQSQNDGLCNKNPQSTKSIRKFRIKKKKKNLLKSTHTKEFILFYSFGIEACASIPSNGSEA